ncbi:MAG: TonB-dependent siderophore receptor [Moraxellaceae bacterium]|nr:TonB-dependent siderophore receptor [Moraxellaceae bacterium]
MTSSPVRPRLRCAALASAVAATLAAPLAHAQQAQSGDITLPAVTVTATSPVAGEGYSAGTASIGGKGDASLKEIPQSVSVVTRDRMDDQNMVRLEDLARRTTGMLVLANDQGRSSIFMRGFELDSYLVDGMPAPLSSIYGSQPDLWIYDRVEVLRGPAGLYNGTGEPGGTVNLARKRALKDFAASGSLSYGSWDAQRYEGDITGSLTEDGKVRGRVVAAHQSKNSWVDVNDNENSVGYGTLEFDIAPRTTVSVGISGASSSVTPFNGLPTNADGSLLDVDRSTFIGAGWNSFKNSSSEGFAEVMHRLESGGHLKAALRVVNRSVNFRYAYASSAANAAGNVNRTAIARDYGEDSVAVDTHASLPFTLWNLPQNLIVGADFRSYDQTTLQNTGTAIPGSINVNSPSYDWPVPNLPLNSRTNVAPEQYGLYANLRIKPWQPLTLVGGARVSWYESTTTNLVTNTGSKVQVDNKFTPFAGVVYDIGRNWAAYASYTEIFQPQTTLGADGQPLDPREGRSFEAGVKGQHQGGLLNSQIGLFRLKDKNRAVAVPATTYSAANGEVEVQGIEAEISGMLATGWEASAGYTFTDTEFVSGTAGQAGQVFSTVTPRHNFNLWTRYDFQQDVLRGAYVGGGLRAMSSFYNVQGSARIQQDAYTVLDALVGYRISRNVDVSLAINNLLDEKYYQRVGGTSVFNFYGEPRSYWLKTSLKF